MKKSSWISIMLLVSLIFVSLTLASEVSQPLQVTDNSYYERAQSVVYDGSNYWLFYARSDAVQETYDSGNPDTHDYRIYYKIANSVGGLSAATPVQLPGSHNFNLYLGETAATVFNGNAWVFASHDADGVHTPAADADIYGWYSSDNGNTWNEVGPIVTSLSDGAAHLVATTYDNEIWIGITGWDTITSNDPTNNVWTAPKSVGGPATGGNGDFYIDENNLYLALAQSSHLALNKYDTSSENWVLENNFVSSESCWDASLLEVGGDFGFFYAPWASGRQWIEARVWNSLDTVLSGGSMNLVSEAQAEGNVWVNMWPTGFTDTNGDKYLFYTSEYNPVNPSSEIPANIWYTEVTWDLNEDHYESYQEAIDVASPGDTIVFGEGTYGGGLVIDKSLTITHGSRPIIDCGGTGVGFTVTASDVTIDGFEIINCDDGILVQGANFVATNNSLHDNSRGIRVMSDADTAVINNNNIYSNVNYGIQNGDTVNTLDAENNWWGHYSGPTHVSNTLGIGDIISDDIDYDPWLCEEMDTTWATVGGICDFDGDGDAADTHGGDDCDDTDADIFVGNPDICDGKNNDCDAGTADGSGEAAPLNDRQAGVCVNSESGVADHEDPEVSCDALDNDCDGEVDEGTKSTFYADSDGDTYGDPGVTQLDCSAPGGYVADNSDCDDTDIQVYPGATEICNGIDDNCDGTIDEEDADGCTFYYLDGDDDSWGLEANVRCLCNAEGDHTATQFEDCNDADADIFPTNPDICDGKNNDCDAGTADGSGEAAPLNDRQAGVCVNSELATT